MFLLTEKKELDWLSLNNCMLNQWSKFMKWPK